MAIGFMETCLNCGVNLQVNGFNDAFQAVSVDKVENVPKSQSLFNPFAFGLVYEVK